MDKVILRATLGLWGLLVIGSLLAIGIGQTRTYPVITFRAEVDNQTDVFLLDPLVRDWVNLTESIAPEWSFGWSQTGNLFYSATFDATRAGDELFIMTRLGIAREIETPDTLSTFGGNWSSDGTRYAYFSSYPRNVSDLFIITFPDETVTNITNTPTLYETDPIWSPDGHELLYLLDGNLYIWDAASASSRLVADVGGIDIEDPVWSPNSASILFYGRQFNNGQNQLIAYLVERTGGEAQRLAFPEIVNSPVTWSPDNQSVAFIGNNTDLIIYNLDSHQMQTVAGDTRRFVPAWSQDGRWIAYIQNRHLYAYDIERDEIRILFTEGQIKPPIHWRE